MQVHEKFTKEMETSEGKENQGDTFLLGVGLWAAPGTGAPVAHLWF